ncbi:MAG: glycoside hydrolase family 13 protein [Chitinophagaceae bacterium]|nr:glycoside hydrolase family 13 protein [Chitinophagaceae bacterium]
MKRFIIIIFIFQGIISSAQNAIDVYPTHWWAGMKNTKLQLLIRSTANITSDKLAFQSSSADVKVVKIHKPENRHYLIIDLDIASSAKPQQVKFSFGGIIRNEWKSFLFQLKARSAANGTTRVQGVTSQDLVYLLLPDRFSNGDPSNDRFSDLRDTEADRNNPFLRHGGDLQGIIDHLDYFNELGVTALWLNPVLENNQTLTDEGGTKRSAYHGYAFTDHYNVDKRLGGNSAYIKLIVEAHKKGLKVIQDAVYNHVGNQHFLFTDPPSKDWFTQWPSYQNTSYKDQPLVDKYASAIDRRITLDGWFTPFLPDLDAKNSYVSNYLIQHSVWTTEEFGIDGWRVDTYFYNDLDFMNRCNKELYREFPKITIFGETWIHSVTNQAYFSENNLTVPWKSNLQGVTDFQWHFSLNASLNENFSWDGGVNKLYSVLAQDILYKDPMRNVIFLDNHDLDRYYSVIGENISKFKMGIALLLTQRGIPQLYYGTEILMKNLKNPSDAEVRRDFPGGFPGDAVNKFSSAGRTAQENDAFNYVKTFANFRKSSSAVRSGRFMQYLPEDGVYVYFRYDNTETVMCVFNQNEGPKTIALSRFSERIKDYTKAFDVATGTTFNLEPNLTLGGKYVLVMKLSR